MTSNRSEHIEADDIVEKYPIDTSFGVIDVPCVTVPKVDDSWWKQVDVVFNAAVLLAPSDRRAYLAQACEDAAMRHEVDELLAADVRADDEGFMDGIAAQYLNDPDHRSTLDLDGPMLRTGELLAGRFRICRLLGAGGMGEVYKAEDQLLDTYVAIKTLKSGVTDAPDMMARFRREVHLARQVTHPSVCRSFDLFTHRPEPAGSGRGEIVFLSMELIEGETLADRVRREGPLSEAELRPIVEQLLAALTAAHQRGIVHRDLKASNVMLSQTPTGVRAVITDFGLARMSAAGRVSASPAAAASPDEVTGTQRGQILGTPAYLAPEQLRGESVDVRTDVYAFGVLMYFALTGHYPFEGRSGRTSAFERLSKPPTPPSHYRTDIEPRWQSAILRCLALERRDRFATAVALRGFLWPPPRRSGHVPRLLASMLLIGMLVGSAIALLLPPSPAPPSTLPPAQSVAVLDLRPRVSGGAAGEAGAAAQHAWVGTAAAELLSMDLVHAEALRALPRAAVVRAELAFLGLEPGRREHETIGAREDTEGAYLYDSLGADLVLHGSFEVAADSAQVTLALVLDDARSGRNVATVRRDGQMSELPVLVADAGVALWSAVGLEVRPPADSWLHRVWPAGLPAARLYAEGLARLQRFDARGAVQRLREAIEHEPERPLLHAALAEAWLALGHDDNAARAAERARALGALLVRDARLAVDACYYRATGDWPKAVEVYRTLAEFHPDDRESMLGLAASYTRAGDGERALEVIERYRERAATALVGGVAGRDLDRGGAAPSVDLHVDPRVELAEAEAALSLADYRRVQAAAERAERRSSVLGNRWLLARAHILSARAASRLGMHEQALSKVEIAAALFQALGDRVGHAHALNLEANLYERDGQLDAARLRYERALAAHRASGHWRGQLDVANNLAIIQAREGELAQAAATYEDMIALATELGDRDRVASGRYNLAWVRKQMGDYERARGLYQEALRDARDLGEQSLESAALSSLGSIARHRAQLGKAAALFREALALARRTGDKEAIASRLNNLALVFRDQGQLDDALAMFAESLRLVEALGDVRRAAQRRCNMARILRMRGRVHEARAHLEQALDLQQGIDDPEGLAFVRARLGLLRLAQGEPQVARELIGAALQLNQEIGRGDELPLLRRDLARVDLALGALDDAEAGAGAARAELIAQGRPAAALSAQLLLVEVTLARHAGARRGRRAQALVRQAEQQLLRADELADAARDLASTLQLRTLQARLMALRGQPAESALAQVAADARAAGLEEIALAARVEAALIGMSRASADTRPAAKRVLSEVARDARRRGFTLLAQKTDRILQ